MQEETHQDKVDTIYQKYIANKMNDNTLQSKSIYFKIRNTAKLLAIIAYFQN